MNEIISTAFFLAFASTITPGPLMALIIGETLRSGRRSGILIGMAPLITDLPIMLASVFVLSHLQYLNSLLGILSIFGSIYLAYLAYGNITIKEVKLKSSQKRGSLLKGIITNFLNPNPYIFYFSILSPLAVKAMKANFFHGPLSVGVFLGVFVIGNTLVALSTHGMQEFLHSKGYINVIKVLGFALLIFSYSFFKEGLELLGLIK